MLVSLLGHQSLVNTTLFFQNLNSAFSHPRFYARIMAKLQASKNPLAAAAPKMPEGSIDTTKWWRYKELRKLNLLLLIPLLSIFSQGYVYMF